VARKIGKSPIRVKGVVGNYSARALTLWDRKKGDEKWKGEIGNRHFEDCLVGKYSSMKYEKEKKISESVVVEKVLATFTHYCAVQGKGGCYAGSRVRGKGDIIRYQGRTNLSYGEMSVFEQGGGTKGSPRHWLGGGRPQQGELGLRCRSPA